MKATLAIRKSEGLTSVDPQVIKPYIVRLISDDKLVDDVAASLANQMSIMEQGLTVQPLNCYVTEKTKGYFLIEQEDISSPDGMFEVELPAFKIDSYNREDAIKVIKPEYISKNGLICIAYNIQQYTELIMGKIDRIKVYLIQITQFIDDGRNT